MDRKEFLRYTSLAALSTAFNKALGQFSDTNDGFPLSVRRTDEKNGNEPIKDKEVDYKGLYQRSELAFYIKDKADNFMAESVPTKNTRNNRTIEEEKMFWFLENSNPLPGDILYALEAAATVEGRCWGMELWWQKRQKGELEKYGIEALDQDRIDWALKNNIDPRMLAICRDVNFAANELLEAGKDLFFEAIPEEERKKIKTEDTIPNPGVVSMLNMTETGHKNPKNPPINKFWGFVYIGDTDAIGQINTDPSWFPEDKQHLRLLAAKLQAETGLPYFENVDVIPGSARGNPYYNGSGGAIGPQFMPGNALLMKNWYDQANYKLGKKYPPANPMDPYTGTIMCDLFLASEFFHRQGKLSNVSSVVKPGFNAYDTDYQKILALMKWNPSYQARASLEIGYDYYSKFGRK
jgi:hypothetical protein